MGKVLKDVFLYGVQLQYFHYFYGWNSDKISIQLSKPLQIKARNLRHFNLDAAQIDFEHVADIINSNLFLVTIDYKGSGDSTSKIVILDLGGHKDLRKVVFESLKRNTLIFWPRETNALEEITLEVEKFCVENEWKYKNLSLEKIQSLKSLHISSKNEDEFSSYAFQYRYT